MNKLTWPEIFVDALSLDAAGLLSFWPKNVAGKVSPIGFSAFGDCFFQHESGEFRRLDLIVGGVHSVAANLEEFQDLMSSADWREDMLVTDMIAQLRDRGLVRGPGQFYGFSPHPAIAGKLDWDTVTVMDAFAWNAICAQALDGVA